MRFEPQLSDETDACDINLPWLFGLTNVQLREKRPLLTYASDWNITKREERVDVIVDSVNMPGALLHNAPNDGELGLAPSYTVRLS